MGKTQDPRGSARRSLESTKHVLSGKMNPSEDIAKVVTRPERLDVLIERSKTNTKPVYWKRKTRPCTLL